jgi:hypothetical protein
VSFAIKGREIVAFLNRAKVAPAISKASTRHTTESRRGFGCVVHIANNLLTVRCAILGRCWAGPRENRAVLPHDLRATCLISAIRHAPAVGGRMAGCYEQSLAPPANLALVLPLDTPIRTIADLKGKRA